MIPEFFEVLAKLQWPQLECLRTNFNSVLAEMHMKCILFYSSSPKVKVFAARQKRVRACINNLLRSPNKTVFLVFFFVISELFYHVSA